MLPLSKQERKNRPVFKGCLAYFPDALAEVAFVSQVGNAQHNPGEPLHWARDKSTDHADCIARHLLEAGTIDADGLRHSAKVAWRALALLQVELEEVHKAKALKAAVEEEEGRGLPSIKEDVLLGPDEDEPTAFTAEPEEEERKDILYISGPMRGYPDFNFSAFDAAKANLIEQGYSVISPADMDRSDFTTLPQHVYALRDTSALITLAKCDAEFGDSNGIYMLSGWEKSKGARAEHALAEWLGLKIIYQEKLWHEC